MLDVQIPESSRGTEFEVCVMVRALSVGCGEGSFGELPPLERLELLREIGFRFFEFRLAPPPSEPAALKSYRSELEVFWKVRETHDVTPLLVTLENDFTLSTPEERAGEIGRVQAQLLVARKLGARLVRIQAGFSELEDLDDSRWEGLEQALSWTHRSAQTSGVEIGIEMRGRRDSGPDGEARFLPSVTTDPGALSRLLEILPPGVDLDLAPAALRLATGELSPDLLDSLAGRVRCCHLADVAELDRGPELVPLGDGELDVLDLLERVEPRGPCFLEPVGEVAILDGLRRSLDALRAAGDGFTFEPPEPDPEPSPCPDT